jgi:hypothetical protein
VLALLLSAAAQTNVYSGNVVGYANLPFQVGDNLFGNPLDYEGSNSIPQNFLSLLIPTAPAGTTVSLWDSAANNYMPTATFNSGAWSTNLTLNPGTGALLHTPSAFTNTFVGTVLDFDGSWWGGSTFTNPPPFAGPDGLYLFSSVAPLTLAATNGFPAFQYVIGRAPHEGEQVTTLDALHQICTTTTFTGGAWDMGDPVIGVGQAAFFNVGPVVIPEPSSLGLILAGFGVAIVIRRSVRCRRPPANPEACKL